MCWYSSYEDSRDMVVGENLTVSKIGHTQGLRGSDNMPVCALEGSEFAVKNSAQIRELTGATGETVPAFYSNPNGHSEHGDFRRGDGLAFHENNHPLKFLKFEELPLSTTMQVLKTKNSHQVREVPANETETCATELELVGVPV